MAIRISTAMVKRLHDEGFLPSECRSVELTIPPAGPMVLRFEVFMTDERLKQLGGAFLELATERAKLTDEVAG
jgi:hypothetical protein